MKRIIAALALLCLSPGLAPGQGLRILNFRPAYGPLGPTRTETKNPKLMQGDMLFVDYTIDGLTANKGGVVSYDIILEFFDSKNQRIFEKKTPNEAIPGLGGNRMPATLFVNIGDALAVGKYSIKLTVKDKIAGKDTALEYPLEVVPVKFEFVHVQALALGVLGGDPVGVQCLVTGFALDAKKECNVDVTIRILDASTGKEVTAPTLMNFPDQLKKGADRTDLKIVPVFYPVTPNRPGQFVFELVAIDRNAKNKRIELKLPLQVLDVGAIGSAK